MAVLGISINPANSIRLSKGRGGRGTHRVRGADGELGEMVCKNPMFDVFQSHPRQRTIARLRRSGRQNAIQKEDEMARYGKASQKSVKSALHREKRGTLKSGKGGKGGVVKSRKQAIAIGLSEARKKGAKVPPKKKH